MEGKRRPFFKKHDSPQFKKKRGSRKGNWHNDSREQSLGNSHASDTLYRILCQSGKTGSVIGKGGNIVKALREETQAKITVADSVPGSEERVIIIYSPPTKIPKKHDTTNIDDPATDKEDELMEPHCSAQDALLKVHDRIVEEDLVGGTNSGDDNEVVVTARLLVPNNMVGCLLGKNGDVIQRLRRETGASIRVLPAEHLPTCAMDTDELVQISGKPAVAKLALYEVSTLLHQNPRKDKPPLNFKMAHGGQSFQPAAPAMRNMLPPGNPMWSERYSDPHGMSPSGFGQGGFNYAHAARGGESPSEFSMKILCSAANIGGVIGKGGFNVKQLQKETGAGIHVEDVLAESDDRVIRVSSFEALWDPRSQTIEAILQLQHKTSEHADDGIITTRLLVPSSKVGCILGQGGHVINQMRRRTRADIRVYSKEDKPKCASEDEELVQISGNFGVAKDALAEIASRLRMRCLRDANAGAEPASVGPVPRLGPSRSLPGARPPPSGPIGAGSSGRYEILKGGGREYEPPSYPVPPSATGFQNISHFMESRIPNNAVNSGMVLGRNNIGEIAGTRVKLQDHQSGGSEGGVEIRGSSEHLNTTQNILQTYANSGGENNNPQQGSYQNYNAEQGAFANINATQTSYQINPQQSSYQINPQQTPYQTFNSQQAAYRHISAQGYYKY